MTEIERIKLLIIAARIDFTAFCLFINYDFFMKRKFLIDISKELQLLHKGVYQSMAISLPPRGGKSYITSLFSAWEIGRNPTKSIMRNTCTATLSRKLSRDTRTIVQSDKYRLVFPSIKLSVDHAAVDSWALEGQSVSYFGAGVGGTIIGFGASNYAITDDLFRSMEDAMSETKREATHSWKESTHESRLESGCKILDIGTRWVKDDVIGRNSENKRYDKEIIIPALINEKSFCETVQTTYFYLKKRKEIAKEIWAAEYQQTPIDIEGREFENLIFTDESKESIIEKSQGALAYIDVADEGLDYTCAVVGHKIGSKIYITDVVYSRDNIDVCVPKIAQMLKDNRVMSCQVETNAMGAVFMRQLRLLVTSIQVVGIRNQMNKQTRILMNSGYINNNFEFFKTDKIDYLQYLESMYKYSKGGGNKNDDAPDATSGLANFFRIRFR